ncbi:MAG: OmpA family protein [Steroidobacteraceae bacterium]|jgi:outer membrane protein OmpA-like peptidoglycan-associated protein
MFRPELRGPAAAWLVGVLALGIGCSVCSALAQPPMPSASAATAAAPVPRSLRRELDRAEAQLRSLLRGRAQNDALLVVREPRRLILRLPAQSLFKPDSATLRANAMELGLGVAAQLLQQRRRLVAQIVVYTDDIGGADANLSLSAQRAAAILKALQSARISAARLVGVGAGEAANLAGNDSPEERTQNRRVEISFGLSLAALPAPALSAPTMPAP